MLLFKLLTVSVVRYNDYGNINHDEIDIPYEFTLADIMNNKVTVYNDTNLLIQYLYDDIYKSKDYILAGYSSY